LDKTLILEILHSHKMMPPPAAPPLEPLPGNSATIAKAGQSKLREHRHARGAGGGASGSGTARPHQSAASGATENSRANASSAASGAAGSGTVGSGAPGTSEPSGAGHALGAPAASADAPDVPQPGAPSAGSRPASGVFSAQPLTLRHRPQPVAKPPEAEEPADDLVACSSQSSNADDVPPADAASSGPSASEAPAAWLSGS